jgi:hypothetical protein
MDNGSIPIGESEVVQASSKHHQQRSNFKLNPFGKKKIPHVNNNTH